MTQFADTAKLVWDLITWVYSPNPKGHSPVPTYWVFKNLFFNQALEAWYTVHPLQSCSVTGFTIHATLPMTLIFCIYFSNTSITEQFLSDSCTMNTEFLKQYFKWLVLFFCSSSFIRLSPPPPPWWGQHSTKTSLCWHAPQGAHGTAGWRGSSSPGDIQGPQPLTTASNQSFILLA